MDQPTQELHLATTAACSPKGKAWRASWTGIATLAWAERFWVDASDNAIGGSSLVCADRARWGVRRRRHA
jgi:hypothetical protein